MSKANNIPILSFDDRRVLSEYASMDLRPENASILPLPPQNCPILISVVKDELERLPDFLRHYRFAGIERFAFIDNGSQDGTFDLLAAQVDVDLYRAERPFDWRSKQAWINRVIDWYGIDRWFLYADADEHIWFDGLGAHDFVDLVMAAEERTINRVRGFLVDMYSDLPVVCGGYERGSRLIDAYPFFDCCGYIERRTQHLISRTGGPRKRLFGRDDPDFDPQLTKYPLFRLRPGEFMVNPHHIWPCRPNFDSPCLLGILHFKFREAALEQVSRAVAGENYWNGSKEYRNYLARLRQEPTITAFTDVSVRFRSPADLLGYGLIEPILWPKVRGQEPSEWGAFERERRRQCRAERLCSNSLGSSWLAA